MFYPRLITWLSLVLTPTEEDQTTDGGEEEENNNSCEKEAGPKEEEDGSISAPLVLSPERMEEVCRWLCRLQKKLKRLQVRRNEEQEIRA